MNGEPPPSGESRPTRIVIADDHPLVRDALVQLLNDLPDVEVVGEAKDGREAQELCRRVRPDLVLMDVRMPRMDGLEATCAIKREFPKIAVLILSSFEDPNYLARAILGGAAGYVLKGATKQEIVEAIRGVLSGESPIDQELSAQLLSQLLLKSQQEEGDLAISPAPASRLEEGHSGEPHLPLSLSPREVEVLKLLAEGRTNSQIARMLRISLSTVKKHVRYVIAKLGVSDRTQAVVKAVELGLLAKQKAR
jgi:DNA-binding NarL/FixJ family response regulator